MQVRLISVTAPTGDATQCKTAEDLMVYCARVSNPSNQDNLETGAKLLKYCLKNGHWSVFESAYMTLEIETSRGIAHQIIRHRSFTFQEFSQRYAEADLGFEMYEARAQDAKNRQNSTDTLSEKAKEDFKYLQEINNLTTGILYKDMLKEGVAKECARFLLPESTVTRLYMTGNVRSWVHYLQARTSPGTQKEHRDVAAAARILFGAQFPVTTEALVEIELDEINRRYQVGTLEERIRDLEQQLKWMGEDNDHLQKRLREHGIDP